jgi:hypothetical protein
LSRRGHPVGKRGAAVGSVANGRFVAAEELGLGDLFGARVVNFAVAPGKDLLLAKLRAALFAEACEKGGQAVVIALLPVLERVVVALGAGDAGARENFAPSFPPDRRGCRRRGNSWPGRCDRLSHGR